MMGMEMYDCFFVQTKLSLRRWLKGKEASGSEDTMEEQDGIDEYKIVEALSPSPEEVSRYDDLENKKKAIMDALKVIGSIL